MLVALQERPHLAVVPDPEPTVELVDVTKRYGRRRAAVTALDGVSTSFFRGTLTVVMGLSGSGKSTLLQCAAGLDRPTSGTVRLGGVDLSRLSRRRLSVLRRRRVGFVFQALNLVPTLTVAENIALPLRLDHSRVPTQRVRELADLVGIGDQLRRLPDTLSGGQQQRVAIARALVSRPDVVFADEPTAALDPAMSETVLGLLRRAVDELGQTVVVVTHAPDVAAYGDRVLLLDRGRVVAMMDAPDPSALAGRLHQLGRSR
jgi:putative ABC transport system ATP-binding protein